MEASLIARFLTFLDVTVLEALSFRLAVGENRSTINLLERLKMPNLTHLSAEEFDPLHIPSLLRDSLNADNLRSISIREEDVIRYSGAWGQDSLISISNIPRIDHLELSLGYRTAHQRRNGNEDGIRKFVSSFSGVQTLKLNLYAPERQRIDWIQLLEPPPTPGKIMMPELKRITLNILDKWCELGTTDRISMVSLCESQTDNLAKKRKSSLRVELWVSNESHSSGGVRWI